MKGRIIRDERGDEPEGRAFGDEMLFFEIGVGCLIFLLYLCGE